MAAIKDYSYTVIFEPLERGGYQAVVPALPEIITAGRTLKEARRMARDAIRSRLTLPDGGPFRAEPLG
jgi:predicted RNase H-like HicB family nuclease